MLRSLVGSEMCIRDRLVGYLNEHNIATVDGTQVGAGEDWRRFYFSALRKADILLPILSKSFIFSLACESELTYAEDKRKIIIPILCDPDYMAVLDTPELYIDMDPDIELRGPKLGAILQQHNRFPANDKFADDFSKNAAKLLARVQAELAKKGVTTAAGGHGDPPQWTFEGRKEDSTIHKTVKFIQKSPTPRDLDLEAALKALRQEWYTEEDTRNEVACGLAIEAGPAAALCNLLQSSDKEIQGLASDCIKDLSIVGGHFGGGLMEFRQTVVGEGGVERLLAIIRAGGGDDAKTLNHKAIMALNYVTRVSSGKESLTQAGGIEVLIQLVNDPDSTKQGRTVALANLWNLVYPKASKDLMIQNGILDMIEKYLPWDRSRQIGLAPDTHVISQEGIKCCFFIASHLSYNYPVEVNECGIVDYALEVLRKEERSVPSSKSQFLEGACRLLDTVAMDEKTRPTLLDSPSRDTVRTMLFVLTDLNQDVDDSEGVSSVTTEKEGAPKEAFKMRAAAALDWMCKSMPQVQRQVEEYIQRMSKAGRGAQSAVHEESSLVWMAVKPTLLDLMNQAPGLFESLQAKLSQPEPSYDLLILLTAPVSKWSEFDSTFSSELQSLLSHRLFDPAVHPGSSMATRWAILCQSLIMAGLAEDVAQNWNQGKGSFIPDLVVQLIKWLQGGHPYKADAAKLMSILVANVHLQEPAFELVQQRTDLLSKMENKVAGSTENSALMAFRADGAQYLRTAIGCLSTQ
eukprot:TRINITY_DN3483_c0_g1_i6.p1 TRINITY_DN3483_c0_g1~~TRINITY_DN3483_c0_g1_i6.p1  ORF type:complete len:746 (-),score=171.31 TRINITY_DN3483_c0_g1_i6:244-2481(-)